MEKIPSGDNRKEFKDAELDRLVGIKIARWRSAQSDPNAYPSAEDLDVDPEVLQQFHAQSRASAENIAKKYGGSNSKSI